MKSNSAQADYLPIQKLHPFEGHPFKVIDNEEMDQLVFSILTRGLLTPLVVRPLDNGEYEVISGHRRLYACQKAGIDTVPALIYNLDRDAAAIALVDSNLHREHILPSEKAFAYKLKMEAMNRQGERTDLTSTQAVSKLRSNELIGQETGESREQVRRYIRLTELEPELLKLVDENKIALTPAVELSYLKPAEQQYLLQAMSIGDCTPSYSQAVHLKKMSQMGVLSTNLIDHIMGEPKANQKEKISFKMEDIRKFFPRGYDAVKIQETIMKLLKEYQRQRQNELSR